MFEAASKVLATNDFVALDGDVNAWIPRGEHVVKGVDEPVPIFELNASLLEQCEQSDIWPLNGRDA